MSKRIGRATIVVVALAAVLLAARIAAPAVVAHYVNAELAEMGDYRGHVDDIDLFLLRGGYALRGLSIVKTTAGTDGPDEAFVAMPEMDLRLQWRALLHGAVVGEAQMRAPVVNLVHAEDDERAQLGTGVNWPAEIRELFPFRLNVVEVHDGLVMFRAPGIGREQSITMRDAEVMLRNLTNVDERDTDAFADLAVEGRIMGNAPLKLTGRLDPNAEAPTFDLDLALEGAQLVDVNPWLRKFLKVDAENGAFSMYSEIAAADGRFEGYVKPILENPQIFDSDEAASGPLQRAWEAVVGFAAKLLQNPSEDQVATQIPFSGEIEDPSAGLLPAFVNLLRNAFVAAFSHSLDGSISLRDVSRDFACLGDDDDRCAKRRGRRGE